MSEPDDRAPKYPPPKYPPPPPSYQAPQGGIPYPPVNPYQQQPYGQVGAVSAYWPLTIISFLMSCLVGGIALYFSYQVGERKKVGDMVGAAKASRMALIWGIVGLVLGGLIFLYTISSGETSTRY